MSISRCTSRRWPPGGLGCATPRSRRPRQQCAQADQVISRRREGHDPIDELTAAVPQLAQPADGLHPPEDLLYQLPLLLADRVAGMTQGPIIEGAALDLLRDVGRDAQGAHARDEAGDVEPLVPADRHRVSR